MVAGLPCHMSWLVGVSFVSPQHGEQEQDTSDDTKKLFDMKFFAAPGYQDCSPEDVANLVAVADKWIPTKKRRFT